MPSLCRFPRKMPPKKSGCRRSTRRSLSQCRKRTRKQQARLDAIEARISELEERERAYTPETLSIAGAILTIDYNGEVDVVRGLVRPEDAPQESARSKATNPEGKPAISASLTQSLTEQKSAAISASLTERPDIALAAVVHALAFSVFHSYGNDSSLQVAGKVTLHDAALLCRSSR
jgi:ParB family chromosome partitioning protein